MFWQARIVVLTVASGLSRFFPGGNPATRRMADSLRWVVHPHREDMFGHLEAALICRCAARRVAREWDADRLDAVATKLQKHAAAVRAYASRPVRLNVERLLSGKDDAYPVPSDDLRTDLTDLAPFISACEEKMGGDGVEF